MKGFRAKYPDYSDMSDDDVLVKMHAKYYSDLTPEDYLTKLQTKFAPDYKPEPTGVIPYAKAVGRSLAALPVAFVKGVAQSAAAPVETAVRASVGNKLEQTALDLPEPHIAALRKRGYSEKQIANIVRGYAATEQSLMEDVGEQGREGVRSSAEAAAFYATLPLGMAPAAAGAKTGQLAALAAKQAGEKGLIHTAGVGAMFGAGYGAIDEGIVRGSDAAAQGAGTDQILAEVTKGVTHGGLTGAGYGALGGVAFHAIGKAGEATFTKLGDAVTAMRMKYDPAYALKIQMRNASALSARAAGLKTFASTTFQPNMLLSRFKPDFDAWTAMNMEQGVPAEHLASNIAAKLYGHDAMMADPGSVATIAQKITSWLDTEAHLNPTVNLPKYPTGSAMGLPEAGGAFPNAPMAATMPLTAVPPGEPLNAMGGLAPDNLPPAVQGPVVQPTAAPFAPPATLPKPMEGLERMPAPEQRIPPVAPEALTPEMRPQPTGVAPATGSTATTLNQPLGLEPTPPARELAPRVPEEVGTISGKPGAEKPAGTVEPLELTLPPKRPMPPEGTPERASLTLPTEPVERVTKAIAASGPEIKGLTTTARKLGGATVDVTPSADGTHVMIKSIKGAEHGTGASSKALDSIIKSADEAQAPLMVTTNDTPLARGGKVSAEKIAQWYEKRGFTRTGDETPGAITLTRTPRDPNALTEENMKSLFEQHTGGTLAEARAQWSEFTKRIDGLSPQKVEMALGNTRDGEPLIRPARRSTAVGIPEPAEQTSLFSELGPKMESAEQAARTRLTQKLGRLSTGFDPTMIGDAAIIGAAKMYRLGMTRFKPWAEEMLKEFGDTISDHLKPIFTKAQEFLRDRMDKASATFETANKILGMARSGRQGMNWFDNYKAWADKTFGADAEMFTRFLSATSAGSATDANVTMAMKAYAQWKLGLPFDGFMGTHRTMLERAVRGEVFGDRKIQNITKALLGDENAVVIDTRVMRTLGFKKAGIGQKYEGGSLGGQSSLTGPQYQLFEAVLRDLSRQEGMTPRQFQSALWVGNKITQAHEAAATGSKKAMSYVANFRPYEDITGTALGGLTPLEWVEKNRLRFEQIAAASEGVGATRSGGGFTYDPYTFKKLDADKGIVVTLASKKVKTTDLTGSDVIDFAKRFKKLTDAYYGMNVGTFNLDKYEPGMSSIDFNVVLPKEMAEEAKALGKARGQHALWDLEAGEEIPTGFTGTSSSLPKGNWDKYLEGIDGELQRLDIPGRAMKDAPFERSPDLFTTHHKLSSSTLEAMTRTPHRWAEYAAQALGVDEEAGIRKLVDEGRLHPMSDYDMLNKVEVHKDGTVWEYVDPEGPSYNIMKLVGYLKAKDEPGRALLGGARLLDYLNGKDVVSGHDVLADYKSQAGYVRVGLLAPDVTKKAVAAPAQTDKIVSTMVKKQGEIVSDLGEFRRTDPQGMSLWVSPDGRVIKVPFHLRSADAVIRALKLKSPVQYEGPEHPEMQTILNHGFARVQMHAQSYAVDATRALTDEQIASLKALGRGREGKRDFVGRITNPNGEHRDFYQGDRALYKFIDDTRKGEK